MNTGTLNKVHYPALDGLRGIAILLVVVFHNFGFIDFFFFGWLGVDLFFVLSGFLITGILLKSVGRPGYLRNFYIRRILRIFPLYYLLLVVCFFVLPFISSLQPILDYNSHHQVYFWTYTQNWLFALSPPANSNYLIHLWSLGVEEQFYLIWPFLILWIRKPKTLLVIVATLLAGILVFRSWLWVNKIEGLQYFSLYAFSRIDGICIGCMLALTTQINFQFVRKYTGLIVISVALLNFAFFLLNKAENFSYPYYALIGYTTFAFIFAIITYEATRTDSTIILAILTNPTLRFFGKISYGFYIFHWPIFFLLKPPLLKFLVENIIHQDTFYLKILNATICTVAALIVSVLSYRFFESPILKLKEKLASPIH